VTLTAHPGLVITGIILAAASGLLIGLAALLGGYKAARRAGVSIGVLEILIGAATGNLIWLSGGALTVTVWFVP
jgi:hypothetical protein